MRLGRIAHEDQTLNVVIDPDGTVRAADDGAGTAFGTIETVNLLAPCEPSKILCVGRNYATAVRARGHAWPDQPFVFLKTANSVIGPGEAMLRPEGIETFEYEGELAVVIGQTASRVRAAEVDRYILGYTVGNDMTVRDWQQSDPHWTRAKSSDTLCPLGPWIETELDPGNLLIETRVNGELQQQGRTDDLIFSIGEIVEYISRTITLVPGDVILTGAPAGTQPVTDGDEVAITVEGIGELRNVVRQLVPAPAAGGAAA